MEYFADGSATIAGCVNNGQWFQSNVFMNQTIQKMWIYPSLLTWLTQAPIISLTLVGLIWNKL